MRTHTLSRGFFVLAFGMLILASFASSVLAQSRSVFGKNGMIIVTGNPSSVVTNARPIPAVTLCQPISLGKINLDGCPEDWYKAGIKPLITDSYGDAQPPGTDLLNVYVTNDNVYVYFLLEFAENFEGASFLLLNVDGDRKTGCAAPNMGFEYGVTFSRNGSYIGDARDCGWGDDDFPGALQVIFNGRFIEATVPLEVLNVLTPGGDVKTIKIFCHNDECEPGIYTIKTAPSHISVGGTMEGLQSIAALCWNLTTGQQVWALKGESHWDCEKMGLKVSPGDSVITAGLGVVPRP